MAHSIEERVAALEVDVNRLKSNRSDANKQPPWWLRFVGAFENDPLFEEAVRNGLEYRKSLTPDDASNGEDGR